jgi:ethanolamine utilization protein EutA (predicted chaperonin)
MTPFSDLKIEAEEMLDYATLNISGDIEEAVDRGNTLIVYISRSGQMLAEAKYYLNKKLHDETMKVIKRILAEGKLSAKVQNALMDSICKDEQFLVDSIERLNRSLTHQMEWCRTLVSKGKEEMRLSNVGKEFRR